MNLQEGRLRNKMHLHSIFKGCFYALKDLDQSQELKTIAKESYFTCSPHRISVLFKLRLDFVIWKMFGR